MVGDKGTSTGITVTDDHKTKSERREEKRRSRGKMRVVGRSVRLLQEIIRRRAEQLQRKRRQ